MQTLAERLGFGREDRIAIVHVDDIGFCSPANRGGFGALDAGPATCGSVMVPCPAFEEAVEMARARPGVDLGVHLTLNCEYEGHRWGPLLGADAVPSLVAADGGFPRTVQEVRNSASVGDVERELRAQVDRALEAGLDVTHLDSHMGSVLIPEFIDVYAQLAIDYRLPIFVVRPDAKALALLGADTSSDPYGAAIAKVEAAGIPLMDGFDANSLHFERGGGAAHNQARIDALGPGVNYLICHAAQGGDALDAITADAHMRGFERSYYGGESGRAALERAGVATIGMRPLRDLVRA